MHLDWLRCFFPSSRGLVTYRVGIRQLKWLIKRSVHEIRTLKPIRTTRSLTLRQSDQTKSRGELFTAVHHHRSPPKLFGACLHVLSFGCCGLCCCGQPTRETKQVQKQQNTKSYEYSYCLYCCCMFKNRSHHIQVRTINTCSYRTAGTGTTYWACTYYAHFRRAAEKLHEMKADGETREAREDKKKIHGCCWCVRERKSWVRT